MTYNSFWRGVVERLWLLMLWTVTNDHVETALLSRCSNHVFVFMATKPQQWVLLWHEEIWLAGCSTVGCSYRIAQRRQDTGWQTGISAPPGLKDASLLCTSRYDGERQRGRGGNQQRTFQLKCHSLLRDLAADDGGLYATWNIRKWQELLSSSVIWENPSFCCFSSFKPFLSNWKCWFTPQKDGGIVSV